MAVLDLSQIAAEVLQSVGGSTNVAKNSVCMTRLRLTLHELGEVDFESLLAIKGVLGVAPYHSDGIEVVFGPAIVDKVFQSFSELTGLESDLRVYSSPMSVEPSSPQKTPSAPVHISSHAEPPSSSPLPGGLEPEEAKWLREIVGLADDDEQEKAEEPSVPLMPQDSSNSIKRLLARSNRLVVPPLPSQPSPSGLAVLVINGPNLNMLGVREPGIYGSDSYDQLVERCEKAAAEVGFEHVSCFQSNHEGALVDEIQAAMGEYDGIVINPGAYTHTSVALLDALKAVKIPAVEVHISEVDKREDFRQISYVRLACFETITGMGIAGYEKAISDLYDYLMQSADRQGVN